MFFFFLFIMGKEGEWSGVGFVDLFEALPIGILTAFYRDLELCVLGSIA